MATLSLVSASKATAQTVATKSTKNKNLLDFLANANMPQGGTGDTMSPRKLSELGFEVSVETINQLDDATFEGLQGKFEEMVGKGEMFPCEVVNISTTQVAVYKDGERTEESNDAIKADVVVTVPTGTTDIKNVKLAIIYRSKSAASAFLQSFTNGDKGALALYAQKIDSKPTIWARVI